MIAPQKKITIEAVQTFSPGNVELLIYLLKKLELEGFDVFLYLGHESTYKIIKDLGISSVRIEMSSVGKTFARSLKKKSHVLFFCSYPPLGKHINSVVYYHTPFFANPYKFLKEKLSLKTKFIRVFVHWIIKLFHQNVDVFYCQTLEVKKELEQNFNNIKVELRPFFNDFDLVNSKSIENTNIYDFFYPATADAHKNYFNLFEAIRILGKKRKVTLVVTVPIDKFNFIQKIEEVNQSLGYEAIINIGRVPKNRVIEYYKKVKAMVFPSLEESLGLPLIEASILNLPIIGSDLPYLYNVVENPIVFNPHDPKDIANKMNDFLEGEFKNGVQKNKINNQVEEIINYFKN